MILAKASLNLDLTMSNFGNPLREDQTPSSDHRRGYDATLAKVERLLQLIMGLQNDILGTIPPPPPLPPSLNPQLTPPPP